MSPQKEPEQSSRNIPLANGLRADELATIGGLIRGYARISGDKAALTAPGRAGMSYTELAKQTD